MATETSTSTASAGAAGDGRAAPSGRDRAGETIADLIRDLGEQSTRLLRQEVALAKLEVREMAGAAVTDVVKLAIAVSLLAVGGLALTTFAIIIFGELLGDNYWLSALIIGALLTLCGGFLALAAAKDLKRNALRPESTIRTLRADSRWAKREVRDFRRELTA